jgi:hypothetical protein
MNYAKPAAEGPSLKTVVSDNLTALAAVAAAAVMLSVGWEVFADRLGTRTNQAYGGDEVSRIWGGPLRQPQPTVRWRRADAATVELASGELARSEVNVDLDVQYRRRGVAEYPCYEAKFDGQYEFKNPSPEASFVAFSVGLPVDRRALMLQEIKLLVNGREEPDATEYTPERIVWTGKVPGERTARFEVSFRARGLQRFGYFFADEKGAGQGKPVTAFRLAMTVKGARGALDFPVGSMSPTSDQASPQGRTMVWEVNRLLSSFDVGVELPDGRGVAVALRHLIANAPFFFLLWAFALLFALRGVSRVARALHVLGLSATYFLYFPLASYLTAYLPWAVAATLSLVAISALAVAYAWRFVGWRAGSLVALSQGFFLAVPAAAYLLPEHTGLILVISGFAALCVGLQIFGALVREFRDRPGPEPLQTILAPPPPTTARSEP